MARLADEGWTEPLGVLARAVYLFGAGHVGRALALALAPLPFAVRWIDARRDAFPAHAPANVTLIHAPEPAAELASAPDCALVIVMTHSHALDLEIVAEALRVERFVYVGLIGSVTKRARFLTQMRAAGLTEVQLARLVCPIGIPGLESKDAPVIAASTAAQLLIVSEQLAAEERVTPGLELRRGSQASTP
jgi:xanthine dehydrogenase accessory factor